MATSGDKTGASVTTGRILGSVCLAGTKHWVWSPVLHEPGDAERAYNPPQRGGSEIPVQPQLHKQFTVLTPHPQKKYRYLPSLRVDRTTSEASPGVPVGSSDEFILVDISCPQNPT